ncbi:hypothetical protein XENTR_v10007256 [Xenopus tropicalis]|nr:hypothetical protein XENTR_v10007256 [Xenopus tropicalis]
MTNREGFGGPSVNTVRMAAGVMGFHGETVTASNSRACWYIQGGLGPLVFVTFPDKLQLVFVFYILCFVY